MFHSKRLSKNRSIACIIDYYGRLTHTYSFVTKDGDLYCNGDLWAKRDPNYIKDLKVDEFGNIWHKGQIVVTKEQNGR